MEVQSADGARTRLERPVIWDTPTLRRGVKRVANDSNLNDDQRFAKRFHCLNLNSEPGTINNNAYYIPISANAGSSEAKHDAGGHSAPAGEEHMQLDDTKDRVYIHDLDEELAEIDAGEERPRLIFLPDIEKHFSRIPEQVLRGRPAPEEVEGQELVLYDIPRSLTVDEDHDAARKAIIEARQRARERATEAARQEDMARKYDQSAQDIMAETAHGYNAGYTDASGRDNEPDPDAMDIG